RRHLGRIDVGGGGLEQPDVPRQAAVRRQGRMLTTGREGVGGGGGRVIDADGQQVVAADVGRVGGVEDEAGVGPLVSAERLAVEEHVGHGGRPVEQQEDPLAA